MADNISDNPQIDALACESDVSGDDVQPSKVPAYHGPSIVPAGRHADCDGCYSLVLNQFVKSFDKSAKRWELIVYPSMFAFIVLAMYGFFLIYSLTQDMRTMAVAIDPRMGSNMGSLTSNIKNLADNIDFMTTHLEYISDNMETMASDVQTMANSMTHLTQDVGKIHNEVGSIGNTMSDMSTQLNNLAPITSNMAAMNKSMHVMTVSVGRMGYDMGGMTRPMSFVNRFMPWGGGN